MGRTNAPQLLAQITVGKPIGRVSRCSIAWPPVSLLYFFIPISMAGIEDQQVVARRNRIAKLVEGRKDFTPAWVFQQDRILGVEIITLCQNLLYFTGIADRLIQIKPLVLVFGDADQQGVILAAWLNGFICGSGFRRLFYCGTWCRSRCFAGGCDALYNGAIVNRLGIIFLVFLTPFLRHFSLHTLQAHPNGSPRVIPHAKSSGISRHAFREDDLL